MYDHTGAYEGINEALSALKADGYKLAVVSNKFDAAVKELCARYFSDTIEVAAGENEAAGIRKKPAPDTVFAALRKLGCSSEEAVYVGDSDVDVHTAKNSGMPCISVLWGFRDRAFLESEGAEIFADTADELVRLVREMK
jgi:phosphoglycolate phosphatase